MVVIVLCKKEEFKYKDVVEAKWCDVVMRIFALSPPKEDLAELAEAIAIGLGGSRGGSFLCGGGGTKYQFNDPTLGRKLCCGVTYSIF